MVNIDQYGDSRECESCNKITNYVIEINWKRISMCKECLISLTVTAAQILSWPIRRL